MATPAGGPGSAPPSLPPPQFFVDTRKGEVNELRVLLRSVSLDKDPAKKRDVIKKVIAYMTLGIDVSRLYPEMVKASRTDDVVMKKMIYLYLVNYAEQNQEMVIMAINTFLMDCKQKSNSKIRGLALRSLCSLKYEGVTQYMQQAIADGLADNDSYVKKTAIIGCVKFFHLSADEYGKTDFTNTLYNMTRDHDPQVVINAIEAINEIELEKGGIEITSSLIIHLLNRIKDFNEWGLSIILDLTAKYKPKNNNEMFDIMNLLEDRFKHASSSVVLGAVKVFLHLTKDDEQLAKKVYERLQTPLITLMTSSETTESYEVSYNVLSHIHLLVCKGAGHVFESEYKHFFIKYDEPSYIKNLKLDILAQIAGANNIQEVVNELSEYVTDVNAEIAKKSIRCFGTIIIRLDKMSKTVASQLRNFLSLRINYVTTETIIVLKDILRKYKKFITEFIPFISKIQIDQITELDGKIALAWILGEFGAEIENSPYLLEKMIEEQKEFNSVKLSLILLNAICKLFFVRAPEVHQILAPFMEQLIKNSTDADLRQRAVFYYRIMKNDLETAKQIIVGEGEPIELFFEDQNDDMKERLFLEFNTLSVVYQKPAEKFLKDIALKQAQAAEKKYYKGRSAKKEGSEEEEESKEEGSGETKAPASTVEDLLGFGEPEQQTVKQPESTASSDPLAAMGGLDLGAPSQTSPQNPVQNTANLLDDVFGPASTTQQQTPSPAPGGYALDDLSGLNFGQAPAPQFQEIPMSSTPDLDSEKFQNLWMHLNQVHNQSKQLGRGFGMDEIQQRLRAKKIFVIANGQMGADLKIFAYAQMEGQPQYFLMELLVNQQTFQINATIKSTRFDLVPSFGNLVESSFQ